MTEVERLREERSAEQAARRSRLLALLQKRKAAKALAANRVGNKETDRSVKEKAPEEVDKRNHDTLPSVIYDTVRLFISSFAESYWSKPRYRFHHREHDPYLVIVFLDAGDNWRLRLVDGRTIVIAKTDIYRILPEECPSEYRTWIDKSGSYSSVGKVEKVRLPYVRVNTIDGRTFTVKVSQLSKPDRLYVESIASGLIDHPDEYRKAKGLDVVARINRFCAIREGGFWNITAEAIQATNEEVIEGQEVPLEFEVSSSTCDRDKPPNTCIPSLLEIHFSSDYWEPITQEDYERLSREYVN